MAVDLKKKGISKEEIEAALLHKFVMKGAWHKYHIYESDVPKGFPPHIRNQVIQTLKELRRKGLITVFPHGREHVYVLNKNRADEILQKIAKYYPEYKDV